MEILDKSQYREYEDFVRSHPNGEITQSVLWHGVKSNWKPEIVVVRDSAGKIVAGASLLVRRIPGLGVSLLYSPRGPVCDLYDADIMRKLKRGIDLAARKCRAYAYKMDPNVLSSDGRFISWAAAEGYKQYLGGVNFETIQARFNYRLYLEGRDEEAVFMSLHHKTRYNIRVARKHGVEVRVGGKDDLGEFMRLMEITGERDGFAVRGRAYFERMLDCLGEHVRLYMAYYQGRAVSGAITTNYAGKTCYIYGASDNEHRNVMPSYIIQWEMIRRAIETNCTVYDFQGVSGNFADENDPLYGLYRFKRGFGGQVDELAGEFDYVYMPIRRKLVDAAVDISESLRELKRRLRR